MFAIKVILAALADIVLEFAYSNSDNKFHRLLFFVGSLASLYCLFTLAKSPEWTISTSNTLGVGYIIGYLVSTASELGRETK